MSVGSGPAVRGECGVVCLAGVGSPTRRAVQQAAAPWWAGRTAPDRAVWARIGRLAGEATLSVVEAGLARPAGGWARPLARTLRARANGAADARIRLLACGSLTLPSG